MQAAQEPRICKQCKYWSYEQSINVCKHDMAIVITKAVSIVDGTIIKPVYKDCSMMRFYSNCGKEGLLFEPKVSFVKQVINQIKQWYANKTTR